MLRKYIILMFMAVMAVMVGCKDDSLNDSNPNPGLPEVVELKRLNGFYDIAMTEGLAWTVIESPEWAGPMNDTGMPGESICLFVETNGGDDDRSGNLVVQYSNGERKEFALRQDGKIKDPDNGTILDASDLLDRTMGVGYAIDVFEESNNSKYVLKSQSPINFSKLAKALRKYGEDDAMVDEDRYFSRTENITGNTTFAISNQLSINAGIEVGICAFKLNVEGGYNKNTSGNDKYSYALQEMQHIVKSRHLRQGILRHLVENKEDIFQAEFNEFMDALAAGDADRNEVFDMFLEEYGTHIITQGSLGGELQLSMQMKITDSTSASDIHAALDLSAKVINVGGGADITGKESSIASNTTISLKTYGGRNVYTIAPGTTFQSFQEQVLNKDNMDRWVKDLKEGKSLSLIDIETMPIYELMPTAELRNALREYMIGTYQTRKYAAKDKDYKGPDLYILKGFHRTENIEMEATTYIPEIDVEVTACRTIMKELSASEYSTVIYSGEKGQVNKKRGFFVGSDTRKPCKFQWKNDGTFEIEEFDKLENGAITELYVDATGNITIFPQSVSTLYREVTFSSWLPEIVDVTDMQNIVVIKENSILTGISSSFSYLKVIVESGVTVYLNNLELHGKLQCLGMQNRIILADGSDNKIRTERTYQSGIETEDIGTLTISGSGNLDIYSFGSGIGPSGVDIYDDNDGINDCGNIVIKDGNISIRAIGGAAIGNCNDYSCGNISILGGYIKAVTSCPDAAAIGTAGSSHGSCGNIFIGRDVEKLIVSKGSSAEQYIGKARLSDNCGSVTIEDPSKIEYQ